jgi:hypothetical protein
VGAGVLAGSIPTATGAVKGVSTSTAATIVTGALTRGGSNGAGPGGSNGAGPGSSAEGAASTAALMKQAPAASASSPSPGSSFAVGPYHRPATPAGSPQTVFVNGAFGPAIALRSLSSAPSALLGQGVWRTLSMLLADSASTSDTRAPGTGVGARPARPVAPPEHAPPSPGGAPPATAAGAGSGLSIFLILAGLPMLAAPWAKRRLRLASEPWHPAPFVLIPERPG